MIDLIQPQYFKSHSKALFQSSKNRSWMIHKIELMNCSERSVNSMQVQGGSKSSNLSILEVVVSQMEWALTGQELMLLLSLDGKTKQTLLILHKRRT